MPDFMNLIKGELAESSRSVTENGMIGYATSGDELVDLNFSIPSFRNKSEAEIVRRFQDVYEKYPALSVVWLFYVRDIRGGMGERRFFRACLAYLAKTDPEMYAKIYRFVPSFGRWDDLLVAYKTPAWAITAGYLADILLEDYNRMLKNESVTLCAKWMPSEKDRSSRNREIAQCIMSATNLTPRQYRRMLTALRKTIDIVEAKMSAQNWREINYPAIPSRAAMIYKNAFIRHDNERYSDYLRALAAGESKINSNTLFPHEIIYRYRMLSPWSRGLIQDSTLEQLWKALPMNFVPKDGTLVVADGSGSMLTTIHGTKAAALDVANALAILFSEHNSGPYANKYITFSSHPQYVEFPRDATLARKIQIARQHNEISNTNLHKVFLLILHTAVQYGLTQNELPKNILVISDMEFDQATWGETPDMVGIQEMYDRYGYKVPRIIFWNVNSRTNTIPLRQNENGIVLCSGFSQNVLRMVIGDQLDPKQALIDVLMSERYAGLRNSISFF